MDIVETNGGSEQMEELDDIDLLLKELKDAKVKEEMRGELEYLHWQIGARRTQYTWYERLGDRAYDFVDRKMLCNGIKPLWLKVGFALFGYPATEGFDLYTAEQDECIMNLCSKIQEVSEQMNADGIYLSVIFVPCFIEANKPVLKKRIAASEYTDVLFIISKDPESEEVRVIDTQLRVYESWEKFRLNNKFPKCSYALPEGGRYQVGSDGSLLLNFEKSPATLLKNKVASAFDIGSIGLGLGGAAVGVAGIFVPVATPIIIGSIVASLVSGAYNAGRSINTLVDRHFHRQSIHFFKDKEARGAWIELVLSGVTVGVSAGSIYVTAKAASAAAKAAQASEAAAASIAKTGSEAAAVGAATAGSEAAAVGAATAGSEAAATANTSIKTGALASKAGRASKAARAAAKAGQSAGEVASKSTRAATNAVAKAGKNVGETAAKVGKNVGRAASKGARAGRSVSNARKIAQTAAKTSKTLSATAKGTKVIKSTAKMARNLKLTTAVETAGKIADETSKSASVIDETIKLGSTTQKVVNAAMATKDVMDEAVVVTSIVTSSVLVSEQASVASLLVTKMSSFLNSEAFKFCAKAGTLIISERFIQIMESVLDFIFGTNSSSTSSKHKDMMRQTMFIIHQYCSGTLEDIHIVQFTSHVIFYFNILIHDIKEYIDKFICKLFTTINNIMHKPIEYNMDVPTTPSRSVLYLREYDDTDQVINDMMTDITRAQIEWKNSADLNNSNSSNSLMLTFDPPPPYTSIDTSWQSMTNNVTQTTISEETSNNEIEIPENMVSDSSEWDTQEEE